MPPLGNARVNVRVYVLSLNASTELELVFGVMVTADDSQLCLKPWFHVKIKLF